MVIILFILVTLSVDSVWMLLGENCCWSLLALKGFMSSHNTTPSLGRSICMTTLKSWRGGGALLNNVLYGEAPPQCPTPLPFYIPVLTEKALLLIYLLLAQWYPVHIPTIKDTHLWSHCSDTCLSPFQCCFVMVFQWNYPSSRPTLKGTGKRRLSTTCQ